MGVINIYNMSRSEEFKNQNQNPCELFLRWSSENGVFEFYNKEIEAREVFGNKFSFLFLKQLHTVKGWSSASESGIYSNEVDKIGQEELNVRSFKGGGIAKGLWRDIKYTVKDFGGHYVRSVYIMLEDGTLANLQLKGSQAQVWYEFTQKTFSRLQDEWVKVDGSRKMKNGSIEYTVPTFSFLSSLNSVENEKAEKVYATLKLYMDAYLAFNKNEVVTDSNKIEASPVPPAHGDEDIVFNDGDDLPF